MPNSEPTNYKHAYAAYLGSLEILQYLLLNGADIKTVLSWAIQRNTKTDSKIDSRIAIVEILLSHGASSNIPDTNSCSAFHHAASDGFTEAGKLFLRNWANFEEKDNKGSTPLLEAAENGRVGVVKVLLASGANPLPDGTLFKKTALSLAKTNGHKEVVELLQPYY
ncbi:ankyrin [Melanomma pulvis-pyrius CBS 109.77]|uniref:Ankyrin n=1 Tax=Melanomma pulvis-pyrius CBS 109.77 TaxID=1314802 RepID=A0A6A6WVT2_9PLEO|nr:ankyrin [Melanomma pulvis-pyrius CBS 109.77]